MILLFVVVYLLIHHRVTLKPHLLSSDQMEEAILWPKCLFSILCGRRYKGPLSPITGPVHCHLTTGSTVERRLIDGVSGRERNNYILYHLFPIIQVLFSTA